MRILGNILWHIPFLGFISAFFVFIFGTLLTLTVVGAPIGLGLIQQAKFLLAPFGNTMISKSELNKATGEEQNIIWVIFSIIIRILYFPFGLIFVFIAIIQMIAMFITIINIPVALVIAKSLGTYFNPINKVCVSSMVVEEMKRKKVQESLNMNSNTTGNAISAENNSSLPIEQQQKKPESFLVWAIICTVLSVFLGGFLALPFAIISIVKASSVKPKYDSGDYEGALAASSSAKIWAIVSTAILAIVSFYFFGLVLDKI